MNFSIEEIKTAIGHLQLDLRGNWGYDYTNRLEALIELAVCLPTSVELEDLISTAQDEISEPTDGRIFRDCYLYGYESDEGRTRDVYDYLQNILSYPEDNNIEISTMSKRNDLIIDILKDDKL